MQKTRLLKALPLFLITLFCFLLIISCKRHHDDDETPQTTPYIKGELVLMYPDDVSPANRAEIRRVLLKDFTVQKVETCICDSTIEIVSGTDVEHVISDSTSVKAPTSSRVGVNGVDMVLSKNVLFRTPTDRFTEKLVPFNYTATRGTVRVAVIDTGLDTVNYFTSSSYSNFLLPSSAANYSLVGITNPALINGSKYFGWNFIDNNQNIMDNNIIKHGTNVTGLILSKSTSTGPEILPLKAFDAAGNSDISILLCALRFAELANAKIINASWGYDGVENEALKIAMDRLAGKNILVVTSAGNANTNISVTPHYPASFSNVPPAGLNNVISMTTATASGVCNLNNYSPLHVDAGAAGASDNCGFLNVFYGSAGTPRITGSSYATALMTGVVTANYGSIPTGGSLKANVLNYVLQSVPVSPALTSKIRTGKRIIQ